MSVVRRTLMRRIFGGAAAVAVTAAQRNGAALERAGQTVGFGGPGVVTRLNVADFPRPDVSKAADEGFNAKWRLLDNLHEQARRVAMRQEHVAGILGMPPHLASMNSTAPWWRAQRAAAWHQERHDAERSLWEMLKKKVGLA